MQKVKIIFGKIILLSFLCAATVSVAAAQSGRTSEPGTQPAPTPMPRAAPLKPPADKSVAGADFDKFKFVFAKSVKGKATSSDLAEYKRNITACLDSLVEEMNRAGADGYRLVSAARIGFVALMKLDEGQYQYRHFEIINNFTRWRADFNQEHEELTRDGFRFVDFFSIYTTREVFNPQVSTKAEDEFTNLFLYEKERGRRRANKQLLVTAGRNAGEQASAELSARIGEKFAEGFYPISVLSPFEILLEQVADKNDLLDDQPEVQIIDEAQAGNIKRKVNALAKQGYRIGLVNNGIFVMYRRRHTSLPPVSYDWLQPHKKGFEKELAQVQAQGAIYRAVYVSLSDDFRNKLIFEVPQIGVNPPREYRIIKFDFDYTENEAENKTYYELTAASKEKWRTMERLIEEGFEMRDLSTVTDGKLVYNVNLLLERKSK